MKLAPLDNLFRGRPESVELRGDTDISDSTMFGHFTPFDTWTEIHSWFEGDFLERVAYGAFKKTIAENRDSVKVQYDHGYDAFVGDSPLGPIDVLREEDEGPYYEVPLLDTDYNRDRVFPLLQGRTLDGRKLGSLLGASFRFRVTRDEWVEPDKASEYNPDKLPERTIREVKLYEFGPVVFPAYAEATAKVRCLTDHYLDRLRSQRAAAMAPVDPVTPPAGAPDTTGHDPAVFQQIAQAERLRRAS